MSDTKLQSKADPLERFRKDIEAATKRLKESGAATTSSLEMGVDTFLDAIGYGKRDLLPSVRSMGDDLADEWAQVTRGHGREYLGLKCGIKGIDDRLNGWDGLALLGAEPNIGKTVLLAQIGRGIVEHDPGAAFVFFSFEMSVRSIMRREMVRASRLPYRVLLQGSTDLMNAKRTEADRLAYKAWNERDRANALAARDAMKADESSVYRRTFVVGPEAVRAMNIAHRDPLGPMRDIVERARDASGCERVFIGIDYLQRIPVDQSAARSDLDRDERTIDAVHAFQRKLELPVLAIAEFRKDDFAHSDGDGKKGKKRSTKSMTAFAGSRRLSYSADALVSMTSATESDEPREKMVNGYMERVRDVTFHVLKGRDGMWRGEVPLEFNIERNTFREASPK